MLLLQVRAGESGRRRWSWEWRPSRRALGTEVQRQFVQEVGTDLRRERHAVKGEVGKMKMAVVGG